MEMALHVPSLDQWDALCLEYKLRWPLHILLTPEVMHADSSKTRSVQVLLIDDKLHAD